MYLTLSIVAGALLVAGILWVVFFWEKGRRSFELAVRSLWLHKLCAALSVLGIIIGTAAVIALMAFGEGSMQDALEDIKQLGATNIIVRSVKPPEDGSNASRSRILTYGLTYGDYDRFLTISEIMRRVPMKVFSQKIRRLEYVHNGRVVGTLPEYSEVNKLELSSGRFLTEEDGRTMQNVAVLGADTAEALFPFDGPLGQSIMLKGQFYRVIGVLRDRMPTAGSGGSQAAENFNHDVYIPLQTCRARFGESIFDIRPGSFNAERYQLSQVTLTVADIDKVRPAGEVVKDLLERNHLKKDWDITVPLDRLEHAEREKKRFQLLLAFIGGISLFVGGIGIMNIMLATVTERTREIGIRRALGAKRQDIILQFLIEAVVQTTVGGLFGVIMGLSSVFAAPLIWRWFMNENLPAKVHFPSIFMAVGVAIVVGVVFGLYPAWKASRLDPIEALRHE